VTIDRPKCFGDAMAAWRALVLTFDTAVESASIAPQVFSGRGGFEMPTWTTTAPDAEGGVYELAVVDPGYVVESVAGYFDPGVRPLDGAVRIDPIDEFNLRLVWSAPACAPTFTLEIPADRGPWQLGGEPCQATATVLRMVDVGLTFPPAAGELSVETSFGQP
jgi:hypothetical protein